jgi:outer membrane protein OmpA-like peptidoglycan-associated protein
MKSQYSNDLQKVAARNRVSSLEELSRSVSLAVYFRTESAEIDTDSRPRIEKLAEFLKQFPEIKLLVEGFADKRGASDFNRDLGQKRALAVESELIRAGIDKQRILLHSYGESRAQSAETDLDGVMFDRRVNITLTLDTQI